MLNLGRRRVFLCRKAVDMRKAYDSLADLVRIDLGMDPFLGDVFVFIGKDCTRAKVLLWESSGFWLCTKRLEMARFRLPNGSNRDASGAPSLPLSIEQVMALLEDVVPRMLRRLPTESR